jgi:hypothetical protein
MSGYGVAVALTAWVNDIHVMEGGTNELELCNRLDQVLIDCDKIRAVFIVDDDIGQTDEEPCFFVDRIGDAIPHRRDEKISDVGTVDRAYANTGFPAFSHSLLLFPRRLSLALPAKKFLALAQLLVFVFAHLLPALFQYARHASSPLERRESKSFPPKKQAHSAFSPCAILFVHV